MIVSRLLNYDILSISDYKKNKATVYQIIMEIGETS